MLPKFATPPPTVITEITSLEQLKNNGRSLRNCTLQGLDLVTNPLPWAEFEIEHTTFLGCQLPLEDELALRRRGAYLYFAPTTLPYQPFRQTLYTCEELLDGYSPGRDNSVDWLIYQHFSHTRFNPSVNEALWQRIHDHAMDDGLRRLLNFDHRGMTSRRGVGFMGGHGVLRTDPDYTQAVKTAKLLAEAGYFVVSGGGPGIMEAANLGAYLAGQSDHSLNKALGILGAAPHYTHPGYHEAALEVRAGFAQGAESLAIPTWFYGHEPSNLFASYVAKYFSNSLREDTLLAIALYGIVYAPGSAGTTQEIFMDAAQNHYGTFNYYSPMVFLGRKRYEIDTSIFPLLKQLSWGKAYHDLLYLTDDPSAVLAFLQAHPPQPVT